MTAAHRSPDRPFFFIVLGLALVGFFIFASASLGLLGRPGATFNLIAIKQLAVLVVGLVLFLVISKIDFRFWRRASLPIFVGAVILNLLLFIPGWGVTAGGATRWLAVGPWTIQPSEFLKLGFVLYLAAWLAKAGGGRAVGNRILLPFVVILALVAALMIAEPDLDTLVIMFAAGLGMLFAAGARWRHLLLIGLGVLVLIAATAFFKPYILTRVQTFLHPEANPLGAGYQINQSLIAIGSGGLAGRRFGQSIQKFKYLPEPIGDSVFSVASEEFGFIGGSLIILLFLAFALSGLKIAGRSQNQFGGLVAVGLVIMIMAGAFINIGSMLGLIPLTGTPLLFVSHGGTALLLVLLEAGIILNVSRYRLNQK